MSDTRTTTHQTRTHTPPRRRRTIHQATRCRTRRILRTGGELPGGIYRMRESA